MIERWMEEGIQAARAGNKREAANLFYRIVKEDETNVEAWLWLSDVLEDVAERRSILEWLSTLEPENRRIKSRLNTIIRQVGGPVAAVPPPPVYGTAKATPVASPALPKDSAPGQQATPAAHDNPDAPAAKPRFSPKMLALSSAAAFCCIAAISGIVIFSILFKPDSSEQAIQEKGKNNPPAAQAAAGNLPSAGVQPADPSPIPPTATTALEPTATHTPLPTFTPVPPPNFQDDFEYGISDQWQGDLSEVKIMNGRLGLDSPSAHIYVGEPAWNNYSMTLDLCAGGSGERNSWYTFIFGVKDWGDDPNNGSAFLVSHSLGYTEDLSHFAYWRYEDGERNKLDNIKLRGLLGESDCNLATILITGKTAEIFWNGVSLYKAGSVLPLNGLVGISLDRDATIDNVVVRPVE